MNGGLIMTKENLEEMTINELKMEISRLDRESGFKPKKREVGANGAILLDPKDPSDREWFSDDYY